MAEIGQPLKRHTVVPIRREVEAPEPLAPPIPEHTPPAPEKTPEKVD